VVSRGAWSDGADSLRVGAGSLRNGISTWAAGWAAGAAACVRGAGARRGGRPSVLRASAVGASGVRASGVGSRGVGSGGAAARGARGSLVRRGSATTFAATAAGAGGATTASADGPSVVVFFGRPRGRFTGAAPSGAVVADGGALTTAAGESPTSLYGFGSSPCALLRGVRGARPVAGLRRSVMSSMCFVETGHGGAKSPARAEGHARRDTPNNHQDITCHAIWNDARTGNCLDETIWSGRGPGYCETALERYDDSSDRRSWMYDTNRGGTHTLRLV